MVASSTGYASTPAELFSAGKFSEAGAAFDRMWAASPKDSATLAYNAGTAWAQAGDHAKAYGYLLKAEQLTPKDSDIKNNLDFIKTKLPGDSQNISPVFLFGTSVARLSPVSGNVWLIGALLCLGFALAGFSISALNDVRWVFLAASLFLFVPYLAIHLENSRKTAVATHSPATIFSGPGESFSEIQKLDAGSWVSVQLTQNDWIKIRFLERGSKSEKIGWVRATDLFLL